MVQSSRLEARTKEIGRELFAELRRGTSLWRPSAWDDRLMTFALGDPVLKVQLFRFVDALPMLRSDAETRRHLLEYLAEADEHVPWWLSIPLDLAPDGRATDAILASLARAGAMRMASRFIAGSTPAEAARTVVQLRRQTVAFTADLLGEAVISEPESDLYQQNCLELIQGLTETLAHEPEIPRIDRDDEGPIPRVNLSIKLSSLTARFDAIHAETSRDRVAERLRPILRAAIRLNAHIHVDMEQYSYKDLTLEIFKSILLEREFVNYPHFGVVIQAYLRDSEADLAGLYDWVQKRAAPITIRLVKGAYWDYEVIHARDLGYPIPVWIRKWETDACYERCARFLLERRRLLRPALAGHNVRSLASAIATAEALDVPPEAFEIQMLHGMAAPLQRAIVARGLRARVYTPYGAMLPGMAYLVRRLLENTSNESFLKASLAHSSTIDELLRDPREIGAMKWKHQDTLKTTKSPVESPAQPPPFTNESPIDFAIEANRDRMRKALAQVRSAFPRTCPILIDGEAIATGAEIVSYNPSDTSEIVGKAARGGLSEVERAIDAARAGFDAWSRTPASERANVLIKAASMMRSRKYELASWIVFEAGKPWREADGDVAEAIDFCEFYAREMLRLAEPRRRDYPGETNVQVRVPRGVAVVIPPWNFPLSIPAGMTAAALVAGNSVILKPAEQTPVVASLLVEILHQAGAPESALHYLPGFGEDVGRALVKDPRIAMIAFTGSMNVGLEIYKTAATTAEGQDHVKRVVAELGGKNAIIVDDDADLDEAVVGVLHSAFHYAGQKCSACSRVIILESVYTQFLNRLIEAVRALTVGAAEDPDTVVGPLIDPDARDRVASYAEIAAREGRIVAKIAPPAAIADRGCYIGPMIVADVPPEARIAQEEIFGPVLSAIRARDLDHAIAIANGARFALTGGIYSRSPMNIDRVKRDFYVGNLYINRPITGALVDRQPFGGFKLSGLGAKTGGPDYLLEFLLTRSITENTLRRGFAPDVESLGEEPAESEGAPEHADQTAAVART